MQIAIKIAEKGPVRDTTVEDLVESRWGTASFAKLVIALAEEKGWTSEYRGFAFFALADNAPYLLISHPAFLSELRIQPDSPYELTVAGVEEAVLAHVAAQLKVLREQSTTLQLKSACLNDAQSHIYRATAQAAVIAMFPEVVQLAQAFVTRKHPKIYRDTLRFKEIKATTVGVSPRVEYVSFKFNDGEASVVFDTENLPLEVRLIPWGYSS